MTRLIVWFLHKGVIFSVSHLRIHYCTSATGPPYGYMRLSSLFSSFVGNVAHEYATYSVQVKAK